MFHHSNHSVSLNNTRSHFLNYIHFCSWQKHKSFSLSRLLLSRIMSQTCLIPTGRYHIYEVPAHPHQNKHRLRSMVISSSDKAFPSSSDKSFPYGVTIIPSSLCKASTVIKKGNRFILYVYQLGSGILFPHLHKCFSNNHSCSGQLT